VEPRAALRLYSDVDRIKHELRRCQYRMMVVGQRDDDKAQVKPS